MAALRFGGPSLWRAETVSRCLYFSDKWPFGQVNCYRAETAAGCTCTRLCQSVKCMALSAFRWAFFERLILFIPSVISAIISFMWSHVARCRGAIFGLLQRVACESAIPALPISQVRTWLEFPLFTVADLSATIGTDMSARQKFLSATSGADKLSLVVTASSTSLFTPTDNVGRRFSCRPTKFFVQPMRGQFSRNSPEEIVMIDGNSPQTFCRLSVAQLVAVHRRFLLFLNTNQQ